MVTEKVDAAPDELLAASRSERTRPDELTDAQAAAVLSAFQEIGLDWSDGENPTWPQLNVRLDLGEDGVLRAGEPEDVAIEVTNIGEDPVFQVSAITESENPFLSRREYFFGYIAPGETRSSSVSVERQATAPAPCPGSPLRPVRGAASR